MNGRGCPVYHLMNPGFQPWIEMYMLLKSDILSKNGIGIKLLEQADCMDSDELMLFAELDGVYYSVKNQNRG